ncbi:MAG TPA: DEAD/DEAH box helicase [Planctomycetota bacterium]
MNADAFLRAYGGQFDAETQDRGERYAAGGAVTIVEGASDGVRAVVQGTRRYDVRFVAGEDGFVASCSCPNYAGGTNCKHLWAVVRVATTQGYLGELSSRLIASEGLEEFPAAPPTKAREVTWRDLLRGVRESEPPAEAPRKSRLLYLADIAEILRTGHFFIRLHGQRLRPDGSWTDPQPRGLRPEDVDAWPDAKDRAILDHLFGAPDGVHFAGHERRERFELRGSLLDDLLPRLCATGRFRVRRGEGTEQTVAWDGRARWRSKLRLEHADGRWRLTGELRRGRAAMALSAPELLLSSGHLFAGGKLARFRYDGAFEWIRTLRRTPEMPVSDREIDDFLEQLYELPGSLPFEIPRKLRAKTVMGTPAPKLEIETAGTGRGSLLVTLSFRYGGAEIATTEPRDRLFDRAARRVVVRDRDAEERAQKTLAGLGFRPMAVEAEDVDFALAPALLPRAVKELTAAGWEIVADGSSFRAPQEFRMAVSSGTDWFDLDGGVKYGEEWVPLPKLLAAARAGAATVALGDGSTGMLPEDWLRKRGLLLGAGQVEGRALRFRKSQGVLLDVLLAEERGTTVDATFKALSDGLRRFAGVKALEPPARFTGTLREYQKLALGWMGFLRRTGLGGCLADDMGLGKTVTVLALLAGRKGPSLAVVPKSLIFNWKAEAERFVPGLRVMDYTGAERRADFKKFDLILTTYGTLRRDAATLKDVEFELLILDEAQAIKNEGSQTAKAARLLKGKQRLALSGTPIENHLGELWSLAEFLNPGLLGRSSSFAVGDDDHQLLSKVVRPWILRRTKAQVVPELPSKTEQTIHVELDEAERTRYDELRDYYRRTLLTDPKEWSRTKFNVLEGLLRLRQAACHPGLIDPARRGESSAKLDALMDQLHEVAEEGHKALVFSQFTSFLDIVRGRMSAENLTYEYLDGQTRDREARVKRFQEDAACPFFLISLKAGGLGLNLTAAEYVFLLDPWWNPAVEAQAMDRAHRIGQTRKVFAYRLVARGTVEEKVLDLQAGKRELADAILREDAGFLGRMTREDLEVLLG